MPTSDFRWDDQATTPLLDALQDYAQRPHAAFYMPGHKQGQGVAEKLRAAWGSQVFRADLPELPELGSLWPPEGAIQAAQKLAAAAFGAQQTWFLVNGSTAGIIAAILATCQTGDKIILPRSVHQSAIAGLVLSGALPVFISPVYDSQVDMVYGVTSDAVAAALDQHPDAKAVMVVYPTYQGIGGDLEAIATVVHQHNLPLLVDEAHGAHFNFHPDFPPPALRSGADLVVQSSHKTLGALTQGSMLHLQGNRVDPIRVGQALELIQSSSPSHLLLASLDASRHQMASDGEVLLSQALRLSRMARDRLSAIPGAIVFNPDPLPQPGCHGVDPTRLTLNLTALGLSGFEADYQLHHKLGVTAELPTCQNLTFVITIGNTEGDIEQLVQGVQTLAQDFSLSRNPRIPTLPPFPSCSKGPVLSPREAFFAATEKVPLVQAVNRVSAEVICPYPPGIPLLMPGEIIEQAALDYLQAVMMLGRGVTIKGSSGPELYTLKVVQASER